MWEQVSVIRTRPGLEDAIRRIRDIRATLPLVRAASGGRGYNLDLSAALELENMAELADIIARAALLREESRAGHFREDFPERSEEWNRNILVSCGNDGPLFTRGAVLLQE